MPAARRNDLTLAAIKILDALGNPRLRNTAEVLEQIREFGDSERCRLLAEAESYYRGTQHDAKSIAWDGRPYHDRLSRTPQLAGAAAEDPLEDMPPWQYRRPFVQYRLARAIVDRFTGLLFGKGVCPELVPQGEDPTGREWIAKSMERMQWWRRWRLIRTYGGAVGCVAAGVKLRNGRPILEVFSGRHCTPLWRNDDPETQELVGLEIAFKRKATGYQDELDTQGRATGSRVRREDEWEWYRRIITPEWDVAMSAPVDPDERTKRGWRQLEAVEHQLGFMPYVWIRNSDDDNAGMDGLPDCDGEWDNLDGIDALFSDAFMATHYNADPTLKIKTGKGKVDVRTGSGRTLWLDPGDEAGFLEYTGDSAKAAVERALEIRDRVLESCRCVLQLSSAGREGAVTATEVLEVAAPMYERADELRDVYGTPMEQLFGLYMRLAREQPAKLEPILRGTQDMPLPTTDSVAAEWDPWFQEGVEAQAKRVSMFAEAKREGIAATRTCVEALQSITGIEDVDKEMEALEGDQNRSAAAMLDAAAKRLEQQSQQSQQSQQPGQGGQPGQEDQDGGDDQEGLEDDGPDA